jgi:hypothetical protein
MNGCGDAAHVPTQEPWSFWRVSPAETLSDAKSAIATAKRAVDLEIVIAKHPLGPAHAGNQTAHSKAAFV